MKALTDKISPEASISPKLVDKNNFLIESNKQIQLKNSGGEWIGLTFIRCSKTLFSCMEKIMFDEGLHFYDTHAFTKLAKEKYKVYCSSINREAWVEVDFAHDYEKAKELFR